MIHVGYRRDMLQAMQLTDAYRGPRVGAGFWSRPFKFTLRSLLKLRFEISSDTDILT